MKSVTGGGRMGTMAFSTRGGASGTLGVMAATVPSGW